MLDGARCPRGDPIHRTLRALIIDDNQNDRAQVIRELGRAYLDLHVRQITGAQAFVEALEGGNFDLVITDHLLRWADGMAILRAAKAKRPDGPVIMFTSAGSEELVVEAMKEGLDDYVRKMPQSFTRLLTAVQTTMERAESRRRTSHRETRLQILLNRASLGVFRATPDGSLLEANQAFLNLLGLSSLHEAQPFDLHKLTVQPDIRFPMPDRLEETEQPHRYEVQLRRTDGISIWVSLTETVSTTPDGDLAIDGLMEEITERKRAEVARALPEPSLPAPRREQRRWLREEVQLEARLRMNGETWSGTALNISLGGVYMVFNRPVSATENQPIQLGLTTEAGVLEIRGTVRSLREAAGPRVQPDEAVTLGLAVEFEALDATKEAILASLLEGLRERSVSVALTGLLIPQETGDLLVEISSDTTEMVQGTTGESAEPERRLVPRVSLAIPVHLESRSGAHKARATDMSVCGVGLRLTGQPDLRGQRLRLRLFLKHAFADRQVAGSEDTPDYTVTGEIVWTAADTIGAVDSPDAPTPCTCRAGVRFLQHSQDSQRKIAELVGLLLSSPERPDERPDTATILSVQVDCRNETGQRVVGYHDSAGVFLPDAPLAIIAPGYGETKMEYTTLSYYFARNGFHVLRYDHTNHVGESDGDMRDTTLSDMNQDLGAILDYAKRTWPASPIAVIAANLAGRVAFKRISWDHRVDLLILLTGIVDVQATLLAVHQEDLILVFLRGVRRYPLNVLGFNVDADRFLGDAIKGSYFDLLTTVQDAKKIRTPVIFLAAEHDAWIQLEAVEEVQAYLKKAKSVHLHLIPEALHRLQDNPRQIRAICRQLVAYCLERFYPDAAQRELAEPSQREIGVQSRLERERARARRPMEKPDLLRFRREYLAHSHCLVNFPDYWQLLDQIYHLVAPLEGGEQILDAGCGNGDWGRFLVTHQAYRQRNAPTFESRSPHYVGVDCVPNTPSMARLNLSQAIADIQGKFPTNVPAHSLMTATFVAVDLDLPLPFCDNQFDRIVCNLGLSYLQSPLFTVREFLRVLSPGGRMVLTNLKPCADLSRVYRNFVQQAERPDDVEETRQLVNTFGKIREAESEGALRFFNRQELAMLLFASGAVQPRIYSALANQAYIAVAKKPLQ
jgi:PAS domain S-box-containing protein